VNWRDPSYLLRGTERQRAAYRLLRELRLFEDLRDYTPVLVGTIPLGIDVAGSDLDIVCEVQVPEMETFTRRVTAAFGHQPDFHLKRKRINGLPTVVAGFTASTEGYTFPVEIFGQPRPVTAQNAYRHMVVEARLLALGGEPARRAIRRLKQQGLKTEPAFARYFRLEGDPYQTLLELAALDDEALAAVCGLRTADHRAPTADR